MPDTSSRIAYVNGAFQPLNDARVSIMDRGFLFADAIYEVTAVFGGRFVDNAAHLARLARSLAEIGIPNPHTDDEWSALQRELVARNQLENGIVYIQVTRGVADREFVPPEGLAPSVVMFTQVRQFEDLPALQSGVSVVSVPDLRWARCDIKSTALLAQVLAKRAAAQAGGGEAWLLHGDEVTEGASSTAFIITHAGEIITRPLSQAVLPGITRDSLLELVRQRGLKLVERAFTLEEAKAAREAFVTSASAFVLPVTSIDGVSVGDGKPGPLTLELRALYIEAVRRG